MSCISGRNNRSKDWRMRSMMGRIQSGQLAKVIALALISLFAPRYSTGADSTPQVILNTTKAGPRSVESLTERALLRDYKFAWVNLEQALESNSTAPLSGLFAGTASAWLNEAVAGQGRSGVTSRY